MPAVDIICSQVNRKIIPAFYHYIQAQEPIKQVENAEELKNAITKLVDAAHPTGPFFLGSNISFVDVQLAPWLLRMRRVLKPYRGWPDPEEGSRWANWVDAVENNRCVKATTSTDELYLDSYERYAGMIESILPQVLNVTNLPYRKPSKYKPGRQCNQFRSRTPLTDGQKTLPATLRILLIA